MHEIWPEFPGLVPIGWAIFLPLLLTSDTLAQCMKMQTVMHFTLHGNCHLALIVLLLLAYSPPSAIAAPPETGFWSVQFEKENLVADFQFGLVFHFNNVRLAFTNLMRSKEFEGQSEDANYGAINLTFYTN